MRIITETSTHDISVARKTQIGLRRILQHHSNILPVTNSSIYFYVYMSMRPKYCKVHQVYFARQPFDKVGARRNTTYRLTGRTVNRHSLIVSSVHCSTSQQPYMKLQRI
jgi:hypothetical protein